MLNQNEINEIEKMKVLQKRLHISRLLLIMFLMFLLVAVITSTIASSNALIGAIVGLLIYEASMLKYNNFNDLLSIVQKHTSLDK